MDAVRPEIEDCSAGRSVRTTSKYEYTAVEPGTPKIEIRKPEKRKDFLKIDQHPVKKSGVSLYMQRTSNNRITVYFCFMVQGNIK